MIILISIGALVATLLGGLFALRFRDKLHLILGFSAGAVIGVALFDLLPEAINLSSNSHSISFTTSITALGFAVYMILSRFVFSHSHDSQEENCCNKKGLLGAGSLSLHSFLDGVGIGLGFKVSTVVGIVVAIAVLTHDFSDGINTVNMIFKNGGSKRQAIRWLTMDAIAPVLGIISTFFFSVSESSLGLILALFSGFFLYIGASDLIPESHHNHPTAWTTVATVLGVAILFCAVRLAGV